MTENNDENAETVPPSAPTGGSENAAQVTKLESEISDLKSQYLYLRADFDNYRKQVIKERSDLIKFGSEPILREFLGILDDLERAASSEIKPETMESFKNGVLLISSQFKKVFERFGVEEIKSQGQVFDPQFHEALGAVSNPDLPPNTVAEVFKKAYKLHGKVIRPAQVVVNSAPKGD